MPNTVRSHCSIQGLLLFFFCSPRTSTPFLFLSNLLAPPRPSSLLSLLVEMFPDNESIMADREAAKTPWSVQSLPKKDPGKIPRNATICFPRQLIHDILGGRAIAEEGFYVVNKEFRDSKPDDDPFKWIHSYRILDYSYNPFAPIDPGGTREALQWERGEED